MATVSVLNMEGKEIEKLELNDNIFGVEINEHLVHLAVVSQLANNRQGTQKAKTRSEVRARSLIPKSIPIPSLDGTVTEFRSIPPGSRMEALPGANADRADT